MVTSQQFHARSIFFARADDQARRLKRIHLESAITVDDIEREVHIPEKYFGPIEHLGQDFSHTSLRTKVGAQDLIKATMTAHASLNRRKEVCRDDLGFVIAIRPYLTNPFSPYEGKIVKYRAQGHSIREIGRKIGKLNYNQQIQRVIRKAELK